MLSVRKILKIALLLLIAGTIAFIFIQSLLPQEQSAQQSDKVGNILGEIIPPETPVGEYVQANVRKIAHFVEFAVLGIWVALYVVLFLNKYVCAAFSYLFALILALFDETIQIFSGRGPDVVDIWIDFAGYASFFTLVFVLSILVIFVSKRRKNKA